MPTPMTRHSSRVDTLELRYQIEKKLGRLRAEKYFTLLARFLSLKISKANFDRLCICAIGRENIGLHNHLLRSLVKNASLSKSPPPKENKTEGFSSDKVGTNGYYRSNPQSLCKDFPLSPRKGRTPNLRDRKLMDRPSPLGPHGKSHSVACEDTALINKNQQSATELISLGSKPPASVEDGEEVDQAAGSPSVYSRSPVTAPLGISWNAKGSTKVPHNGLAFGSFIDTCYDRGELPDTDSLKKRLQHKLQREGLKISVDCANLLNNSIDVYIKSLIKRSLEFAGSRSRHKPCSQGCDCSVPRINGTWPIRCPHIPNGSMSTSILDFKTAMELDPKILGEDWPTHFEKICLCTAEARSETDKGT